MIYRICNDKERIGTWKDVRDILNAITGFDYGESTYRKKYQNFNNMFDANQAKFVDTQAQLDEIIMQRRQLEIDKVQFRDERRAWSSQNYSAARFNEVMELLSKRIPEIGKVNFSNHYSPTVVGDTDLLVCLSDLHIGQTFNSYWGEFDSLIAKERLEKYLNEIIEIGKTHNSTKVHIASLGDQISGNIRKTIQISNKENVIEQIKLSIEYISSFCYELTKQFEHVYFYDVNGNHSRLDPNKDDAVKDERLDNLIGWTVCKLLDHIDNFHDMTHRKFDSSIGEANIRGKNYLLLHGDLDSISKTGIGNLVTMLGFCPDYCVCGHNHTPAMQEFNGIQVYQSGSLPGSGCDYTVKTRLSGRPSQTVLVCNAQGVKCCYNVNLK